MPKWKQSQGSPDQYGTVSFGTDTDQSMIVDPFKLDSNGVISLAAPGASSYDTTIQRTAAGLVAINGTPLGPGATVSGAGNTVTGDTIEHVLAAGLTLPSGANAAGQTFRFVAWGLLSTTLAAQTVDLRLRLGGLTGTNILDFGAQQPNSGGTVTGGRWRYVADILFLTPTNVDVSGEDSLNFFFSSETGANTNVSNSAAQQLVLTEQGSAAAVSVQCTGFYCTQVR